MAYSGYLIKIKGTGNLSDYVLPLSYMLEKTYKGTYSVLDSDSKRNAKGKLIRTALSHKVPHCSVDFRPLSDTEVGEVMSNIRSRFTKTKEHKLSASVWIPMLNDYVTDSFYIPDTEFTVRQVTNTSVEYDSFTLELIGY